VIRGGKGRDTFRGREESGILRSMILRSGGKGGRSPVRRGAKDFGNSTWVPTCDGGKKKGNPTEIGRKLTRYPHLEERRRKEKRERE